MSTSRSNTKKFDNSNYSTWLVQYRKSLDKLLIRLKEWKIPARIIEPEKSLPIVRIHIPPNKYLDLKVKELKHQYDTVWIDDTTKVNSNVYYIIICEGIEDWLYTSGNDLLQNNERRRSDYDSEKEFFVMRFASLKPFRFLLQRVQKQLEKTKQRELTDF